WASVHGNDAGEPLPSSETTVTANRRLHRVALGAWLVMALSGAGWLALESARMSGPPLGDSLNTSTVFTVLAATVFGQAWSVRAWLALGLAAIWPVLRASSLPLRRWASAIAVVISGGLLAGLAWGGHANAEVGLAGWVHHASDVAHLLAAGAWLGGLAPLAALLGRLRRSPTTRALNGCADIAARFGNRAALSVGVLLMTGTVNAYFLVQAPPALLATTYGNLLLAKLLLFALMLAIATANRTRLTAALRAREGDGAARVDAARRLRRNVWVEQALGAGVIALVGILGVTPPPMRM
ncbi:MAG TPA: CopD family protein, partial [Caldimonas sp.]